MNPKPFTLMAAAVACLVLVTTGCSKSSAGPERGRAHDTCLECCRVRAGVGR